MIELDITNFPTDFEWDNGQFPPLDALTYWHFLKGAKRSIEIGYGYSTFLAKKSGVEFIAIDPEPIVQFQGIGYFKSRVENTPLELFGFLEKDDILFVDSSHEYHQGSDVYHVIHNVIPRLKSGVLIQFHDYFQPDDYPADWKTDSVMSKWNEQYHVYPLEKQYEVLIVNNTVSNNHNEELIKKYPFVPKNIKRNFGAVRGSSIWFRK